jgi:hypothetical protein
MRSHSHSGSCDARPAPNIRSRPAFVVCSFGDLLRGLENSDSESAWHDFAYRLVNEDEPVLPMLMCWDATALFRATTKKRSTTSAII